MLRDCVMNCRKYLREYDWESEHRVQKAQHQQEAASHPQSLPLRRLPVTCGSYHNATLHFKSHNMCVSIAHLRATSSSTARAAGRSMRRSMNACCTRRRSSKPKASMPGGGGEGKEWQGEQRQCKRE